MKLLVVIDVQNDFVTGSLRNEEAIKKLPNVCKEIRDWKGPIILTKDTHYDETYSYSIEGQKLPVPHCIRDTWGWKLCKEVVDELYNTSNKFEIVTKPTFGFDGWKELLDDYYINTIDCCECIDEIEVIGYCTDICVISNVLGIKSVLPNVPIKVKESCCAGVTVDSHKNALQAMKMCHIDIID